MKKTVEFGKMTGYPQYLKIKLKKGGGHIIDMVSDPNNKPNVGDELKKVNDTWNVIEVEEERPAKGNHPIEAIWQRLICD